MKIFNFWKKKKLLSLNETKKPKEKKKEDDTIYVSFYQNMITFQAKDRIPDKVCEQFLEFLRSHPDFCLDESNLK